MVLTFSSSLAALETPDKILPTKGLGRGLRIAPQNNHVSTFSEAKTNSLPIVSLKLMVPGEGVEPPKTNLCNWCLFHVSNFSRLAAVSNLEVSF